MLGNTGVGKVGCLRGSARGSSRGRNRQAGVRQKIVRKSPGRLAIACAEALRERVDELALALLGNRLGLLRIDLVGLRVGLGERAHLAPVFSAGDVALSLRQGADPRAVRAFGRP